MPATDATALTEAIRRFWPRPPSEKARRYVDKFFDQVRIGKRIMAKVQGNHGIYTVSIEAKGSSVGSACSCYIGKYGGCHHCHALALTFLKNVGAFKEIKHKPVKSVQTLADLQAYLQGMTLDPRGLVDEIEKPGHDPKGLCRGHRHVSPAFDRDQSE